jgi:hypothetical protein
MSHKTDDEPDRPNDVEQQMSTRTPPESAPKPDEPEKERHPWSPAGVFKQLVDRREPKHADDMAVEITKLPGIDASLAKGLAAEGVRTPGDFNNLRRTSLSHLSGRLGISTKQLKRLGEVLPVLARQYALEQQLLSAADTPLPQVAGHSPNTVIVDPFLLCSLDRLVAGKDELNIRNLHNLSALTEALVLHEALVAPVNSESIDSFVNSLEVLVELGLMAGQKPEDRRREDWTVTPVSGLLTSQGIMISETTDYEFSDLSAKANGLLIFEELTLRTGIASPWNVVYMWELHETARAHGGADILVKEGLGIGAIFDRFIASEAARRGWETVHDLTSFALNWAPLRPSVRARRMMKELDKSYQAELKVYFEARKISEIAMPMLTTLVLSRCSSPSDIPRVMLELRQEYRGLREVITDYEFQISEARSLDEFARVDRRLTKAWDSVRKSITGSEKRLFRRVFDVGKSAALSHSVKGFWDELFAYVEERVTVGRLRGFVDIWTQASRVRDYDVLLRRTFGKSLSSDDVEAYTRMAARVRGGP